MNNLFVNSIKQREIKEEPVEEDVEMV